MVEMHFHIFGALAFLLVYRDWRVIVIAAGFIALHHLGFMVLQDAGAGVYVMPAEHLGLGMVLLHAVFVVFETSVLVLLVPLAGAGDRSTLHGCAPARPSSAPSSRRSPPRSSGAT